MKKFILILLFITVSATCVCAQSKSEEVVLPDAMMRQVVRRILSIQIKPRQIRKKIYVSGLGIKKTWLPKIRNIHFVVVREGDSNERQTGYRFFSVEKQGKVFMLRFGFGDLVCGNVAGRLWEVEELANGSLRIDRTEDKWGIETYHCV